MSLKGISWLTITARTSIFLMSGVVITIHFVRSMFMSPKEAAHESKMLSELVESEMKALQGLAPTPPPLTTTPNPFMDFIEHNYSAILVLIAFLQVLICIIAYYVSIGPSRAHSKRTCKRKRRNRK